MPIVKKRGFDQDKRLTADHCSCNPKAQTGRSMMYKLAFIMATGESPRLWLCDNKHGARTVMLNGHDVDEFIAAFLSEGWEPFGIGTDNAIWFRKLERVSESSGQMVSARP